MELIQSLSGGLVAAAAVFIVAWLGKNVTTPGSKQPTSNSKVFVKRCASSQRTFAS